MTGEVATELADYLLCLKKITQDQRDSFAKRWNDIRDLANMDAQIAKLAVWEKSVRDLAPSGRPTEDGELDGCPTQFSNISQIGS